ncbi:MAG: class I SAM-dependent RNA methyltransferase [Thermodesulfobacteriota bacterium]
MPEVLITGLSSTGEGIGRVGGKVVFIPFTLPGEVVEWELSESKKSYDRGRVLRIIEPSLDRIEPPCPFFMECGGCQLQHLDLVRQGKEKEKWFREGLVHALKSDGFPMLSPLISPDGFGYRHRLQLKTARGDSKWIVGFFGRKSHQVIGMDRCLLANEGVNRVLGHLGEALEVLPEREESPEIELQLYEESGRGGMVLTFIRMIKPCSRRDLTRALLALPGMDYVLFRERSSFHLVREHRFDPKKDSPEYFVPALGSTGSASLRLKSFPLVFTQANLALNKRLIESLEDRDIFGREDLVVDFYSGLGNLSLPLARVVQEVVGIESFPPAVDNAMWNQEVNGIFNSTFLQGTAEEGGTLLKPFGKKINWIILDPPRSGAKEVISLLDGKTIPTEGIIYLSCNPQTLFRDLSLLKDQGWKVQWSQVIDFFPQTYHLESLTLLRREGGK